MPCASGDKCYGSTFREPKAILAYALVVSVPTGNLTLLCLRSNVPVLSRKPGQPSLRFYVALHHVANCVD